MGPQPQSSSGGSPPSYDSFVPTSLYAPVAPRDDGRLYVRVSMSNACVGELLPGPIQVRNGDLIPVPPNAHSIDEIRAIVGADSLGYLSLDGLIAAIGLPADNLCNACFHGRYPMPIDATTDKLALERARA